LGDCPEKGGHIAGAFSRDGLAVSTELLGWRDTLVLAGWYSDVKGVSGRLDLLADVEACLPDDSPVRHRISYRWLAIIQYDTAVVTMHWKLNFHLTDLFNKVGSNSAYHHKFQCVRLYRH
jgi:hypothetical protein